MSLRIRVLEHLRVVGPSTVPALAEALDANPSRVAESLHVALRRDEVYRLSKVAPTKVRGPRAVVGNLRRRSLGRYGTRPQVWALTGITWGVE